MTRISGARQGAWLPLGAALALVLGSTSAGPAQAQGFNLFEQLFGGPARQMRAPVYPTVDPYFRPERARAARAVRKVPAARTRYAGLPSPSAVPAPSPKKPERGAILDTPGALKAILEDPTLRPGDIVVFPSGPRVFTGSSKGPHRMASFEPLDGSRLVSKATAAMVAGLSAPAAPAKLRLRAPAAKQDVARTTPQDGPRVVYQDTMARR